MESHAFSHAGKRTFEGDWVRNEDRCVVRDGLWAVIDGATALQPLTKNGMNTSEYTAQWLCDALNAFDLSDDATASEIIRRLERQFGQHLRSEWLAAYELAAFGPRCTVCVVRQHGGERLSWAQMSDSYLAIEFLDGGVEIWPRPLPYDETDAPAQDAIAAHVLAGMPISEAKVQEDVQRLDNHNRVISQKRVFDGHTVVSKEIAEGELRLGEIRKLLLATDGFVLPGTAQSFDESAATTLQSCDLEGVEATWCAIRDAYNDDRTAAKFPRFKHMDDATAVLLRPTQPYDRARRCEV